jgi:hypothetical protein
VVVEGTYQEAVTKAHEIWKALKDKKLVTVHTSPYAIYWWHWIGAQGEVIDRNSPSRLTHPESYNVKFFPEFNAYREVA